MIGKFTNSHSHSTPPPKSIDYIPEWVWDYSRSHGTTSDHHKWLATLCRTLNLSGAGWWRGDSAKYSRLLNDYSGFAYTYDYMGRMIDAQSFVTSLTSTPTTLDNIRESVVYDKNSNILQLNNVNGLASTYRTYTLNGNKVSNITINRLNTGVCSYDNRGNMTKNTEAGFGNII